MHDDAQPRRAQRRSHFIAPPSWPSLILLVMMTGLPTLSMAGVFYRLEVVAETGTHDWTAFGNGPSINSKGKVAFVTKMPLGDSIGVWSPVGGVSDIATSFVSSNRSFGESAQINSHDEVVTFNRRTGATPSGEVRIFRSATANDSTVMMRALPGFFPDGYDVLFQFPTINSARVLEDRSAGGDLNGVCGAGERCVSQTAFGAFRAEGAKRTLNTVVKNPQSGADFGVFNEAGLNTTVSRPQMADDGRIVVRGNLPTSPILLYQYALGSPVQIAGTAEGFTVLGVAPGITPDGKIVAFAGNRGNGDGVFLSIEDETGKRRLVRIVGENASVQKAELGYTDGRAKLFFESISLDSRVGIVYTPDNSGKAKGSVVVSFLGTPNAASRTNPGTGKPFTFTDQLGLWTMRIDLNAPMYQDDETLDRVCLTRVPLSGFIPAPQGDDIVVTPSHPKSGGPYIAAGKDGRCQTPNDDRTDTLFSRTSPIPVVQIGDTIRAGGASHVVTALAVNVPLAEANFTDTLSPRTARIGDHRVVFWAQAGSDQFIVRGDHLDSDQDGLLDHWETQGISLDGSGVDLDLAAMGANPFKRDLFIQMDWSTPRGGSVPVRYEPQPGVIKRLAEFFATAPALPNGIPAGIQLHVDAGPGLDVLGRSLSRNMGLGPVRGGQLVTGPTGKAVDLLYMDVPGTVTLPGVSALAFDTAKRNYFWNHHRGAREFAFLYVVFAGAHHGDPDNSVPVAGRVTRMSDSTTIVDTGNAALLVNRGGGGVLITGGTGQGQFRRISVSGTITATGEYALTVNKPWDPMLDASSQYMLFDGSGGLGGATVRNDNNFGAGKNLAITLGSFGEVDVFASSSFVTFLGSFDNQWQTIAHEIGHLLSLKHGGTNHSNYKPLFVSLMNYAYQLCPLGSKGTDASGAEMLLAASCPVNDYGNVTDLVHFDWLNLDMKSSLNFGAVGNAFGRDPEVRSPQPPEERETMTSRQFEIQFGPQDLKGPTVTVTTPAASTALSKGSSIPVGISVDDNKAVARAEIAFDVNGDGAIDEATEIFAASRGSGKTWSATLPAPSGPDGTRTIRAIGYDTSGNPGMGTVSVRISASTGPVPGDVDGDGRVTCVDASLVRKAFGKRTGQAGFDVRADVVKDGVINVRDLAFVTKKLPVGTICR